MNEKKIIEMNDEALLNVAGGSGDNDTTYKVGQVVEFQVFYGPGEYDREIMTGTITMARGQLYAIKYSIYTYTVKEQDILTPPAPKVETGVHATENGAAGSW